METITLTKAQQKSLENFCFRNIITIVTFTGHFKG